MNLSTIRSRASVALACLFACACVAHAAPGTLTIRLQPSDGQGTLAWGLLSEGKEIASGDSPMSALAVQGTALPQLVATLPADAPDKLDAAEVWLTINADALISFVPSVGDRYCHVKLACAADGCTADATQAEWQTLTTADPANLVLVHYHRGDDEYKNVGLWTWDERRKRTPEPNELRPAGRDAFGAIFQVDANLYGTIGESIGLLPRRNFSWGEKDGGDRYWRPALGKEVYIVQDDNRVYAEKPDVSPKVGRVTLDAEHHLTVRFTQKLPVAAWTAEKFKVATSEGKELHVKAVYPFKHTGDACGLYSIEVAESFDFPRTAYALTVEGFGTFNVEAGYITRDAKRYYDADAVMGASYSKSATTFRVFAPGAIAVQVVIADVLEGDAGLRRIDMTEANTGIWTAKVDGDLAGKYYAYCLRGYGFNPDHEIADIYATCTQAMHDRSLIVDLRATDPPGFRDHKLASVAPAFQPVSAADAIIYEMHVRDFTIAPVSGVSNKGNYLGLTEKNTTLIGDTSVRTCLEHLSELGITHVQLMPVQDFHNDELAGDHYNWGYMPMNFFSPDGWLAEQPLGPGKITELKSAIQTLHARGIRVIMDVVYNHTAGEAPFERLVPGYYFRHNDAGELSDGSGCGNEFASENAMARKFLLDSVKYWVSEYKVDGFRFDLMGLIDLESMKLVKSECAKLNPDVLVYGEPWTGGASALKPITDHSQTRGTGLGAFNDKFRDALKGDRDGGGPGFIQVGQRVEGVVKGLMGSIHDWAADPVDSINYFEAHDNLTAWDKLLQSVPDAGDADRRRMMRLGALALFTSQGTVFLQAGQEMCRTKKGSHNSYNQPDEINQVDWALKKTNADVVEYHKGLIALRKAHPVFRLRTRQDVEKRVFFAKPPDPRVIMYELDGTGLPGETAKRILVYMNGATAALKVPLPEGEWSIYADANKAGIEPLGKIAKEVELPPNSGVMLMRNEK